MPGYSGNTETVTPTKCRYCYAAIAWLVSKRNGKKYAVNAHELDGEYVAGKADFHKCKEYDEYRAGG